MSRITPAAIVLLCSVLPAARAQVTTVQTSDLFRVRTASAWMVGALEPIDADSFRVRPRGGAESLVIRRDQILALQRSSRSTIRPLAGLALGAGAGLVASVDFAGPIVYYLGTQWVTALLAIAEVPEPDWPDYAVGPLVNRTAAVAVGAGVGFALGMIPRRIWAPVDGFAFDQPGAKRRSYRRLGATIGFVAVGSVAGALALRAAR